MDDIYLAEFHGFIDEKTWEVARLSVHYLQALRRSVLGVLESGGVLERYSDLRDLIEVVRICILHGILVGADSFYKPGGSRDDYSLYHFVRIFPEMTELGGVDDMCFLSFLLLNKVFTGFLESVRNPLSKWSQEISVCYHHASILRHGEFLREFTTMIDSFESCLRIKNFHIPNGWMTHFAKLSLRWNHFGNSDRQTDVTGMREGDVLRYRQMVISHVEDEEDLGPKSSLSVLLKQEFERKLASSDYSIYDDRAFVSKSSVFNSRATFVTDYDSNSDLDHETLSESGRVVYSEENIQDIEELLGSMWGPVFDSYRIASPEACLNIGEDQGSSDNRRGKRVRGRRGRLVQERDGREVCGSREGGLEHVHSLYVGSGVHHEEGRGSCEAVDDYLLLVSGEMSSSSNFEVNYEIKFTRDEEEVAERYLHFYNIPLNKQEERLVLELQSYKCFTSQCGRELELKEEAGLNFCCYTGYYYCDHCFGQSTCSVLPGLLTKYGNLTPVPVSSRSRKELKALESVPLIRLGSLTAEMWESNKYIKQLVYLRSYLSTLFALGEVGDGHSGSDSGCLGGVWSHKCQYRESIKRRLAREYEVTCQYGRNECFSVSQLTEIAYEMFSQEVTMCSSETNLQSVVRELTEIAVNWRKHLLKCIHCQLQHKQNSGRSISHRRNGVITCKEKEE